MNKESYNDPLLGTRNKQLHFLGINIELKQAVTWLNFLVLPLSMTANEYLNTYLSYAMVHVLRDKEFFNVPPESMGSVTSNVLFLSQLWQVPFVLAVGYCYDILGRRATLCLVLSLAAVLMWLLPYTAPSIPLLIAVRIGAMMAVSALTSHPFVNDYIKKECRGQAAAIQAGAGTVLGNLLTFFVMINLTAGMSEYDRFMVFGLSIALLTGLFFFMIREPRIDIEEPTTSIQEASPPQMSFFAKLHFLTSMMWRLCKTDIVFAICLIGQFTSRTVHFLFGTFLVMIVTQEVTDRTQADGIMQVLKMVPLTITMLMILPIGKFVDAFPARITLPVTFSMVAAALFLFQLVPSPAVSITGLTCIAVLNMVGQVSANTTIEAVYTKNIPKEVRGTMNGAQTFFGTVGQLLFLKIGGYMYDEHGPRSPYLLVACVYSAYIAFVVWASATGRFKH